jgi:hypothetical protein
VKPGELANYQLPPPDVQLLPLIQNLAGSSGSSQNE